MKKLFFLILLVCLFFNSCTKDNFSQSQQSQPSQNQPDWLIPASQVQDGGPGKDGIPSIDNPNFISTNEVNFLEDTDLVIGMVYKEEVRAYPHPILDWHEIVNDVVADRNVALTYCPLTGTAIAWNRTIDGETTTFGVSGKLYNNNLIPYDRATDSYWSQINLNCVNGERIGYVVETFPVIETTWKTWKTMYPDSKVLSTNTGFSRNYQRYPYGDYRTNHDYIIFPLGSLDDSFPAKERVLGVLTERANKAYSINLFETPRAINDVLNGDDLIVIGSKTANFIVAFYNKGLDDLTVDLSNLPIIGTDARGNQLDINGKIIAGPLAGIQLEQPVSFMGYWFSFGAFYSNIDIY